jgi:hypothetical protein
VSGTEKRFTRRLRVRVARYEMLQARADGRLSHRVPLYAAVHELRRALRARAGLRRQMANINALDLAIMQMQDELR